MNSFRRLNFAGQTGHSIVGGACSELCNRRYCLVVKVFPHSEQRKDRLTLPAYRKIWQIETEGIRKQAR